MRARKRVASKVDFRSEMVSEVAKTVGGDKDFEEEENLANCSSDVCIAWDCPVDYSFMWQFQYSS